MKIYFTCSTAEFKKYEKTYFEIRQYLIDEGHILTRDWLPHTKERFDSGDVDLRDIKQIYAGCIDAIRDADVVIIEDSVSNFSTGHQITKALQFRSPTLVLWQGRKHRQFEKMFIHGVESDMLEIAEYSSENLKDNITLFLNKYKDINQKNRFHLVLDGVERNYLDWAQYTYGESRTKTIRKALRDEIDNDEKYKKYLSHHFDKP